MDQKEIAKKLLKLADEIQRMEKEEETIKQLEATDPDKARKMMSAQLNKLMELHEKQKALFKKCKKANTD